MCRVKSTMFEAFRDETYGSVNLAVAMVLGAALLLAVGWIWLAGINPVEIGLAVIAAIGLVVVARWMTGGILFSAWYGGRMSNPKDEAADGPDQHESRKR